MDTAHLASPLAVLGYVVVALVGLVVFLGKRKNGNGNGHTEEPIRDRVVKSVAYIEEHGVPMPDNWRDLPFTVKQIEAIDKRIAHKRRSDAMQFGILATLLERGLIKEAATILRQLEQEAKDAVNSHGGSA